MTAKDLVTAVTSTAYAHPGETVTIRQSDYLAMLEIVHEKVEREEAAAPHKPTLEQMERAIRSAMTVHTGITLIELAAAADTLRRLQKEGPRHVGSLERLSIHGTAEWLKLLGVEAK